MQDFLPVGEFRPDTVFDDPARLASFLRTRLLPQVNRPGRYLGGELGAVCAPWSNDRANMLLTFPDAYEVGISNNGLRQLYAALNHHSDTFADLAFAPWPDMEARMRAEALPLWGLQSAVPARSFDVLGFSLGYELCYTNLLTMLDLSGIPLHCADRGDGDPVVIAGGHCAANPAVLSTFIDIFCIGDGEEIVLEIADVVNAWKREGGGRADLIERLHGVEGTWWEGKTDTTTGRVVTDLNAFPPLTTLVPTIEAVHDRLSIEVMRGCVRGCRFCQAGMLTRPVRERDVDQVVATSVGAAEELGWKEISLLSLSTCDYTGLSGAMHGILEKIEGTRTNLELPSLRVDALDADVYELLQQERPGSFTFAPEAGSQRLRDVINKNITLDDVLTSTRRAFASGAKKIKLYFMIGLPTETDADLDEAVDMVEQVVRLAPRGGSQVTVSFSPFSPKAHTPFQWAGQIPPDEIRRRNYYIKDRLRRSKVKVSLRDPEVSTLEGLLGLGDGRLAAVVETAWRAGARFDGWDEHFDHSLWHAALDECGVDPAPYLAPRNVDDPLPWDGVFAQVGREFLIADWQKALEAVTVKDCRLEGGCEGCEACTPVQKHVFAEQLDGTRAKRGQAGSNQEAVVKSLAEAREVREADIAAAAVDAGFDARNADRKDPTVEDSRWVRWRERAVEKCWYRVEYVKTGDAAFLGHLDFQRQLQLALRRTGVSVAYSKGFHPHPLIKFGPPLPVGIEGEHELLDLCLTHLQNGWVRNLAGQMPPGIRIHRVEMVGVSAPEAIDRSIDRMDYRIVLPTAAEGGPQEEIVAPLVAAFLEQDTYIHLRRRPKGDVEIDVRPMVADDGLKVIENAGDGHGPVLALSLSWQADKPGLPVLEFLAALFGDALVEPRHCRVRRTDLLMKSDDGTWVSPLERIREQNQKRWLRAHLSA